MSTEPDIQAVLPQSKNPPPESDQRSASKRTSRRGDETHAGALEPKSPFPWLSSLLFVGAAIAFGALVWYFGQAGRSGLAALPSISFGPSGSEINVIDARADRALLVEKTGNQQRVLVQETGNSNWRLVSLDDYSVAAPVLASDGKAVAYRSAQDGAQVVIAFLDTPERINITNSDLTAIGPSFDICPWTPIAWSPENERLAFYVCDTQSGQSLLVWTPIATGQISPVAGTEVDSDQPRDVEWLNPSQVITTIPSTATTSNQSVATHDVN